jgi:hypothetical protein
MGVLIAEDVIYIYIYIYISECVPSEIYSRLDSQAVPSDLLHWAKNAQNSHVLSCARTYTRTKLSSEIRLRDNEHSNYGLTVMPHSSVA